MVFSNNDIARYYDLSEVHYRIFWDLERSKSLHYGYWDSSTENFHQALLNINRVLSSFAGIRPSDRVLDAGCGIGGSSIWLATNIGCFCTGISLSQKQIDKARTKAEEAKVSHLTSFDLRDFTKSGYPDESFDIVWAIESVCHAEDKSDFLKEAFRILKKGGRLILADFFKKENLQGKNADMIRDWAHGWAVPDFSTLKNFKSKMKEAGFSEAEIIDATEAIRPSAKRLYRSYWVGILGAKCYALFKTPTDFSKKNVRTAYLQYKTLRKGLWEYSIVKAIK
jgi:cyclopropane fatty-acyl-phospholipid synthase-like methyltransferase